MVRIRNCNVFDGENTHQSKHQFIQENSGQKKFKSQQEIFGDGKVIRRQDLIHQKGGDAHEQHKMKVRNDHIPEPKGKLVDGRNVGSQLQQDLCGKSQSDEDDDEPLHRRPADDKVGPAFLYKTVQQHCPVRLCQCGQYNNSKDNHRHFQPKDGQANANKAAPKHEPEKEPVCGCRNSRTCFLQGIKQQTDAGKNKESVVLEMKIIIFRGQKKILGKISGTLHIGEIKNSQRGDDRKKQSGPKPDL